MSVAFVIAAIFSNDAKWTDDYNWLNKILDFLNKEL